VEILEKIAANLAAVREQKPLVHHITNYVTVNDCANITLALGGSPVMADDLGEVAEMTGLAAALVLNIGTLNARTIEAMLVAGRIAGARGIPVVLDPVGVGATRMRTETAARIIRDIRPAVIRGNMSEIKLLAGLNVAIKGVDSVADAQDGQAVAQRLARELACVVAITGKRDIICDGTRTCYIDNGHELLAQVTGSGCMATSLVATYCGAGGDCFTAAVAGITTMGLAGELAQKTLTAAEGSGTFRIRLFDKVFNMTPQTLLSGGKISHG
jgi:hydroxyethylthiazole kinase